MSEIVSESRHAEIVRVFGGVLGTGTTLKEALKKAFEWYHPDGDGAASEEKVTKAVEAALGDIGQGVCPEWVSNALDRAETDLARG